MPLKLLNQPFLKYVQAKENACERFSPSDYRGASFLPVQLRI